MPVTNEQYNEFYTTEPCKACDGKGMVPFDDCYAVRCTKCGAKGFIATPRKKS